MPAYTNNSTRLTGANGEILDSDYAAYQKLANQLAKYDPKSKISVRRFLFVYRVTYQVVKNLLLTSKQKFRFGLARPGQARPSQAKVELLVLKSTGGLHNLMCHPVNCQK